MVGRYGVCVGLLVVWFVEKTLLRDDTLKCMAAMTVLAALMVWFGLTWLGAEGVAEMGDRPGFGWDDDGRARLVLRLGLEAAYLNVQGQKKVPRYI